MIRLVVVLAALLALPACLTKRIEGKVIRETPAAEAGPKATPEELAGEVPALRGPMDTVPLVPPELVPPEPPPDPDPSFD